MNIEYLFDIQYIVEMSAWETPLPGHYMPDQDVKCTAGALFKCSVTREGIFAGDVRLVDRHGKKLEILKKFE
jgi:hypothetical protein